MITWIDVEDVAMKSEATKEENRMKHVYAHIHTRMCVVTILGTCSHKEK